MTFFQIAVNNLRRRKAKMFFVVLGLVIGIATVVSVTGVVETMKVEMTRQMDEYGANIVITPDTGELAFSYGGITIPEVLFDVEKLSNGDVAAINSMPDGTGRSMLRAVSPKLLGVSETNGKSVIVAGSNLQNEFSIKPWLRLSSDEKLNAAVGTYTMEVDGETKEMEYERLDLSREDLSVFDFADDSVFLGATVAETLGAVQGDTITLGGIDFNVLAVLEENASPEDSQIMMNLTAAQNLLGRPGEVTVIEVSADYSLGSENALIAELSTLLPHASVTSLRQAMLGRDEMLTRLTRFGMSVSVLVLFVGLLVVGLTMSGAVRERTREIGIFRAIGFRKSHVAKIILLEGLIVSTLGGVIGYVAGMLMAGFGGPLLAGMELSVPWRLDLFAAAVLLAVLIGALASLYPARQAAKLDPAEALRFI
ncbi:MAG: FtsX-like permease family protein [Bacillota bacterium]|nr:FtsX-like permease family protein [Bacillota bacterium]MDW7683356.1 FtsX-like permease family protein [Bacillota bacterium]